MRFLEVSVALAGVRFLEVVIALVIKDLFTCRWGNPPSRGRKIKRVYMQYYNLGVLGWGFLRFLLRLQLGSLSTGVSSSHLEKDERSILGHVRTYSWKRHALCYAVLGYAWNRRLNALLGIVWETKYDRFTTLNIPKCDKLTLLACPLRFLVISAMRQQGNAQSFKTYVFSFWAFCHECVPGLAGYPTLRRLHGRLSPRLTGLSHLADRATRHGGLPHLSCKRDQDKMRDYMKRRVTPLRRVTSRTCGPPPPCKLVLRSLSGGVPSSHLEKDERLILGHICI